MVGPVREFVTLSRRLGEGELTSAEAGRLDTLVREDLAKAYRIPFPVTARVARPAPERTDRHLRGLWHELTQHLRDLRYLDEAQFLAYHQHKRDILRVPAYQLPILEAVIAYLPEDIFWPERREILPPGNRLPDLDWLSRHLPVLTERLGLFTSWTGLLPPPPGYFPGEASPYGRSLAYRLRTLRSDQFSYTGEDAVFPQSAIPELNALLTDGFAVRGTATETKVPRGYWTHLADADLLLNRYLATADRRQVTAMLYQIQPADGPPVTPLPDLIDLPFDADRLPKDLYDRKAARKMLRRAKRREDRGKLGLDKRLLQLKLWQTGYYVGALDGDWGPVSHTAYKVFLTDRAAGIIEAARAERGPERKLPARVLKAAAGVRTYLLPADPSNGVYVADLRSTIALLSSVGTRDRAQNPTPEDALATVDELRHRADLSAEELDEKILAEEDLAPLYPDPLDNAERRVCFHPVVLLKRVWGGLGKLVRWLKDKVKGLIENVLGPVFSYVKQLLRPLRLAVTRFFNGFKFLTTFALGNPVVTEVPGTRGPARFATRFSLDFDATTLAPEDYLPGGAAQHAAHLSSLTADLGYFVDGVLWVVKVIGRLGQPGGWVWLGLQLARAVVRPDGEPA